MNRITKTVAPTHAVTDSSTENSALPSNHSSEPSASTDSSSSASPLPNPPPRRRSNRAILHANPNLQPTSAAAPLTLPSSSDSSRDDQPQPPPRRNTTAKRRCAASIPATPTAAPSKLSSPSRHRVRAITPAMAPPPKRCHDNSIAETTQPSEAATPRNETLTPKATPIADPSEPSTSRRRAKAMPPKCLHTGTIITRSASSRQPSTTNQAPTPSSSDQSESNHSNPDLDEPIPVAPRQPTQRRTRLGLGKNVLPSTSASGGHVTFRAASVRQIREEETLAATTETTTPPAATQAAAPTIKARLDAVEAKLDRLLNHLGIKTE